MAIYHFSAQVISRAKGRSCVAAVAYRAGPMQGKMLDERTGAVHDYSHKKGVVDTFILAPDNSPNWVYDRARLWNEVESAEKRKDAQTAREINIALPTELSREQQIELVRSFVQEEFVDRGMVADVAIHDPKNGENPHFHLMVTTRSITEDGFQAKNRDWNDRQLLQHWRMAWAEHANVALEQAGYSERIDHRSLLDQGIVDREPTIHEGPHVRAMEEKGMTTERRRINRDIEDERERRASMTKEERLNEILSAKDRANHRELENDLDL